MRSRSLVVAASLVSLPACAGARSAPEVPPQPVAASAAVDAASSSAEPTRGQAAVTTPRDGRPTDFVAKSGRVSLSAFALAGRVTWQGMRTVGRAAAGLFASGAGAAERGWRAGVKDTRTVARHEADVVKGEARATEE
jgi:hypothetical protein